MRWTGNAKQAGRRETFMVESKPRESVARNVGREALIDEEGVDLASSSSSTRSLSRSHSARIAESRTTIAGIGCVVGPIEESAVL